MNPDKKRVRRGRFDRGFDWIVNQAAWLGLGALHAWKVEKKREREKKTMARACRRPGAVCRARVRNPNGRQQMGEGRTIRDSSYYLPANPTAGATAHSGRVAGSARELLGF